MSCSCGCSPCCCTTATETDPAECADPGIAQTAAYSGVFAADMCARRLLPYRGVDGAGNPITSGTAAYKAAVQVQGADGVVRWSEAPCNEPPEDMIRVANDAQAADLANYIPFTIGKDADGCERRLVGSDDTESGQWKYVWISSLQMWTTVPDDVFTDLCTLLAADLILDPDNTEGYLIQVDSTSTMTVGVSLKIGGYEMVVTEVVDDEYVRVESVSPPASPATLQSGTSACNIGFRPCPRSEEPYADTPVFCLGDVPVSLTMPDDISGMAAPGLWWRDQLGQVSFLPAPVDATTGIITAGLALITPASPADNVANLPAFRSVPRYQSISQVTLFTQLTGGLPVDATSTVDLSLTSGWIPGATAALISIDAFGLTGTASYHAYIKINGEVRAHVLIGTDAKGGAQFNGPFLVPLDADTEVDIEVDLQLIAAGSSTQFSVTVFCNGYWA